MQDFRDPGSHPRYSRRPLPERRYLPGRPPRPSGREAAAPRAAARLDPEACWACEGFRYGVDLWNHGFFWEAHEAWEDPWRAAGRETEVGRALQGLILLAAAALKRELGARGPARRLAARGARRMREARMARAPIDVPAFTAALEAWIAGALPTPPLLRLEEPGDPARP